MSLRRTLLIAGLASAVAAGAVMARSSIRSAVEPIVERLVPAAEQGQKAAKTREAPRPTAPDGFLAPTSPLVRGEHPRLFFTATSLAEVRARVVRDFGSELDEFIAAVDGAPGPARRGGKRGNDSTAKPAKADQAPKAAKAAPAPAGPTGVQAEAGASTPATSAADKRAQKQAAKEARRQAKPQKASKPAKEAATSSDRVAGDGAPAPPARREKSVDRGALAQEAFNCGFLYRFDPARTAGRGRPAEEYGRRGAEALVAGAAQGSNNYLQAIAYDWLHDVLTPDERSRVVKALLTAPPQDDDINPFDDQPMVTRVNYVMSGLAVFGDETAAGQANAGNTEARVRSLAFWDYISGAPTSGVTAGNFIAADHGAWSQGLDYAGKPATVMLLQALEAFRSASGRSVRDVFADAPVFRLFPRWLAYHLLPQGGGVLWRTHNTDAAIKLGAQPSYPPLLASLRIYADVDPDMAGLAQWFIDDQGLRVKRTDDYVISHFLMGRRVTPRSPTQLRLPMSERFTNYGWVVMRTQWSDAWVDASDSYVAFTAATWSRHGTYWQKHPASFTIDRGGPLVIHSGTTTHHGYGAGTWSGNTIIFPDPGETLGPKSDRGGRRSHFGNLNSVADLVPGAPWDVGGIGRFSAAAGPGSFDYVYADVTRTYNGPLVGDSYNEKKVARFTRQLVYLRPTGPGDTDRLVVFDRTQVTAPRFVPRWLLHPSREPSVGGTARPNVPVRNGSGLGKTTYVGDGNGRIAVVNDKDGSSGRLWVTSLLPRERDVIVVGGPNEKGEWGRPHDNRDPSPPSHEFEDPYGAQIDRRNAYDLSLAQYIGQYRLEILPARPATDNAFLTVIEAGRLDAQASAVAGLGGRGVEAARVGKSIVVFGALDAIAYSDGVEATLSRGEFTADTAGEFRLVVADLAPNARYRLTVGDRDQAVTATSAGTIEVTVTVQAGQRLAFEPAR